MCGFLCGLRLIDHFLHKLLLLQLLVTHALVLVRVLTHVRYGVLLLWRVLFLLVLL
jgi:hypothetical protein